ncbi:MAG TPA: hypothetical protein VKK31_12575 [Thermoanaerobaculia bacterium]|nr:hypothetical protein [Thermoanaerobaculia bacterium]
MKHNVLLTITSLLAILFSAFHITDDIVYKIAPGGLSNLTVVVFLVVWLYAMLVLDEGRWGYAIVLLLSVLASGVPILHMKGSSGITAGISNPSAAFFFAWTLLALEVTAVFSVILSAHGLWSLRRGPRS